MKPTTTPNWNHEGDERYTAFDYSHTLKVSKIEPLKVPYYDQLPQCLQVSKPFWAFTVWDLENNLKAIGREESLEMAQACAEVQATLLEAKLAGLSPRQDPEELPALGLFPV
jgi:hypothetical protein